MEVGRFQLNDGLDASLQMSSNGFLMVALTETKDNLLSIERLKILLGQYNLTGVGLAVYDQEKQEWVKLTKQMLEDEDESPSQ